MSAEVVITGHTRGVGHATYNVLEQNGFKVTGLSRKNGFDLLEDYEKVKSFILDKDPDIFVNNAYVTENQTRLLKELYEAWSLKDKLIVNVCSVAALVPPEHPDYNMPYVVDKREQKSFCDNINFHYSKANFLHTSCGLINLCFDYVRTSFKSKHDKRLYPNLDSNEVANVIWYTIQGFRNNICFREISFHSTKAPELRA